MGGEGKLMVWGPYHLHLYNPSLHTNKPKLIFCERHWRKCLAHFPWTLHIWQQIWLLAICTISLLKERGGKNSSVIYSPFVLAQPHSDLTDSRPLFLVLPLFILFLRLPSRKANYLQIIWANNFLFCWSNSCPNETFLRAESGCSS